MRNLGVVIGFILGAFACSAPRAPARPTTGAIAGLARDHDTGDLIAKAEIRVAAVAREPRATLSDDRGSYELARLAPGKYRLVATFAGQPVAIDNVEVRAGATAVVDIVFTLGRPDPIAIDNADLKSKIERYHPKHLASSVAIIEGTVNDNETRERVVGAVVTAVADDDPGQAQHTVSDDFGRYRFELMPPGVYAVSAYYSISGRGQVEVRRGNIAVAGAEAVVVPLWIEMTQ